MLAQTWGPKIGPAVKFDLNETYLRNFVIEMKWSKETQDDDHF